MKGLYISAVKKSSGKSTISVAIARILANLQYKVITFKKGPDYIDPMWLAKACRNECYNLDFFYQKSFLERYFYIKANDADFTIVEGNHGLYDDMGFRGRKSNAELAKKLKLPVLLVIDVSEFGRTIVPVILGIKSFDKNLTIKGLILNKIQNKRHEMKLLKSIKAYINIPVYGLIPENNSIKIEQRHLGISSCMSECEMEEKINNIAIAMEPYIDIKGIIDEAFLPINKKPFKTISSERKKSIKKDQEILTVGIFFDRAFNFYYRNNIDLIKKYSKKIIYVSPLTDRKLSDVDFLYIGGGFPELFAEALERNYVFKESLLRKIENGLPLYAECGGLIYLGEDLIYDEKNYKMLGLLKTRAQFNKKPVAHGYVILGKNKNSSTNMEGLPNVLRGHEFHHFYVDLLNDYDFAYKALRGKGIRDGYDGLVYKNTMSSFSHIYDNEESSLFISLIDR
jgi:cobyrinic acid a,c-diamide synthase